jgi:hypothetical protein
VFRPRAANLNPKFRDYQLLLARDLKLINAKDYGELAQRTTEVKRMLGSLLGKLNAES